MHMRRLICLTAAAMLCITSANAADALKVSAAPVASPCTPISCTGWYAGVNLTGMMTNANVIGNGINGSVAAGGQSIGVQAGFQFANGTWFFGPEIDANYVVNGNPNVTGGSPQKYRVGEYVKIGTALSTLLNIPAPATGTPGIPAALANAVISPYIIAGAVESSFGTGWATGAGVEFALAQNWFLDTRYTYVNYGSASASPTETVKSENLVTVALNYKF